MKKLLARAWPWALGLAIVIATISRVPLHAFATAIHEGPHLRLLAVDLGCIAITVATDAFATWLVLVVMDVRWSMGRTLVVRGTTYLWSLLSYAVGQAGLGYYLHRDGMSGLRATGVTLFTMGTTFATLILVTTAAWGFGGDTQSATWWTLVALDAAFVVYLVVIVIAPAWIARREPLAPLFDTGVRGHAIAMVGRLPHVVIAVLSHWFALRAWGVPVPFVAAATVMPAVVVAGVIPISPAGMGTIQVALVYFFSDYATGPTADDRAALVLAFSIVHLVYQLIGQLAVGLACVPFTREPKPDQA